MSVVATGTAQSPTHEAGSTKAEWVHEERAEVLIRWRGVCWFGFLLSSRFVSSGSALIGSYSSVSRSSSSSKYILFSPLLFFILYLLAFPFLF